MKLICVLLTVFALGATPAYADDLLPKTFPSCELKKVGGEELCAYDLDTWKLVLKSDAELVHLRIKVKKELEKSAELALQVDALQSQVDKLSATKDLLVERNDKLVKDIIKIDKKYQDERVKPQWGSPVAWTVAAVAAAVLGGFVINDALN